MKTSNFRVISLLLLLSPLFSLQVNAQVGINTLSPDASSMLDIQSDAKGVLIPRMLGSERTAIASPANGLLVFDTESKSFWYYNGTATTPDWKELASGSSIVDADGDTRIEVEKVSPDVDTDPNSDAINFTARGVEYMKIGADGVIKLGNRGPSTLTGGPDNGIESDATGLENYTKITADGSLSYVGNATRWEDLKVPVFSTSRDGTRPPDNYWYQDTSGGSGVGSQGVFAYWFDANTEEEVYFMVQMPHAWKEGTDIYPHVHWSAKSNVGTAKVQWGLEYTWANVGTTHGATTIITGNTPISVVGSVDAYEHAITKLGSISGSGKTLSSMIICRVFRDADAGSNDTYGSDAALFEIDFHYQVDSDGSNQEFSKE